MGTISLTLPVTGTVITAGLHSTNYTTIQNAINGGLDNNNINASAAIAQSKLAFDAWQTYTPAWTSNGSAPAIGNATVVGKYVQIGKTVIVKMSVVFGSTSTFGTGTYRFSIPVTASSSQPGPNGAARLLDNSSSFQGHGHARVDASASTFSIEYVTANTTGSAQAVGATLPWTWAQSDVIDAQFTYEAV